MQEQNNFFDNLNRYRGISSIGNDSIRFLELNGANIIEPTAFEPDPTTHRHSHYYNALTNTLYQKIITREEPGVVVAYWKKVSN